MKKKLLPVLACPLCNGELDYLPGKKELVCQKDLLAFPLRDGVPVLLLSDTRKLTNDQRRHMTDCSN